MSEKKRFLFRAHPCRAGRIDRAPRRVAALAGLAAALLPGFAAAQDSDGDGVVDLADASPCDAGVSAVTHVPSLGALGTLAFEDQWPEVSDLDFNDVVLRYNLVVERDASGVRRMRLHLEPAALGGFLDNGLGWQLPVPASALLTARRSVGGGAPEDLPREDDALATLRLSPNLRELFGGRAGLVNADGPVVAGQAIDVELTFAPGTALSGLAPYDVFVFRARDFGHQIHFPRYAGTRAMRASLFGSGNDGSTALRRFVYRDGTPFALDLQTTTRVPRELARIDTLFPRIASFAASGGALDADFYRTEVVAARGIEFPAAQLEVDAPDTACTTVVAEWKLDEGAGAFTGDTAAAFPPAPVTGRWVPGRVGTALELDGRDQFVDLGRPVPAALRPTAGLTIEAWVRPSADRNWSGTEVGGIVAAQHDPTQTCWSLSIDYRDAAHGGVRNGVHFQVGSPGYWTSGSQGTTNVSLPIGRWTHVVAVAQPGAQYRVYFDGQRVANWTPGASIGYSAECRLALGFNDHAAGSRRFFAGAIDEVRVHDRALSADEVRANYLAAFERPEVVETDHASCLQILRADPGARDGLYGIDPDGAGPAGRMTVLCDMTRDGGGWTLAYKHSTGVVRDDVSADLAGGALNADDASLLHRGPSARDLASPLLTTHWSRFGEARVEVTQGGAPAAFMRYRTAGTTAASFMARSNLLSSSWSDLLAESQNFWGAAGDTTNRRRFFVNRSYGGCPSDVGWLAVPSPNAPCTWENARPSYPVLYSTRPGATNWTSGQVGVADALLVFVRERITDAPPSCVAIAEAEPSSPSGRYLVDPDGSGHPFQVFCDMTTDGGGWTLLYKHSAGVAPRGVTFGVDVAGGALGADDPALLDRARAEVDLSSPLVARWSRFSEARVEVVRGGAPVAFTRYATPGTTASNFFARGNLVGSSWTDLLASGQNFWGLDGDTANGRGLFINRAYNSCPNDTGWMIALANGGPCAWESRAPARAILHASGETFANWQSGPTAEADAVTILVRERAPVALPPVTRTGLSSCRAILEASPGAATGLYTIDPDGDGAEGEMTVLCEMTEDGGGWTLAYKHSSRVVRGSFASDLAGGALNARDPGLLGRGRSTIDFVSPLLTTHWSRFSQARVEVARSGAAAAWMRYGTSGATATSFFTRSRLQASSWSDLLTQSQNYWSIDGDTTNARHFFINRNYGGCNVDEGWLVVSGGAACSWESARPRYSILFAPTTSRVNWSASAQEADALLIYVR